MTTKTQIMTGVTSTASSSCFSGPSSRLCFMYLLERRAGQGAPCGWHCFWGCRHGERQRTWPPSRPTMCMRVPRRRTLPPGPHGKSTGALVLTGRTTGGGLWHLGQAVAVLWEEGCGSHRATLALAPAPPRPRPNCPTGCPGLLLSRGRPCPARPEPQGPLSSSPGFHAAFLKRPLLRSPAQCLGCLASTHPHTQGTYFLTSRLPAQ